MPRLCVLSPFLLLVPLLLSSCKPVVGLVNCRLLYFPPNEYGTVGDTMGYEFTNVPVDIVFLGLWSRRAGDGYTGAIDVTDDGGFFLVSLQDTMKRDSSGVPRRWTNAYHYQLQRESDGRLMLYEWIKTVGRAGSPEADAARAGRYPFERATGDLSALRRSVCR